ncbi:TraI/MobA(P) family conjugative relaxase [Roseibium album]|uniref:Conjugal transfer relaxase TraI n=1 Tax=Roseibium album TaxID=311410 RepID=A0A0M7AWA6_9HYPH|nr:TraI/MobA(P) family conjugative relaxase [Roseibium album]CTQ63460.1 conjugal transfer relaxase TraI [Roseibium album]CTQ79495.1 conjugal transfer relaxase TraI [Roseibium album]CTQ81047.1 conjugal transfer relaxase TraI [Roseibium album]
MIAKKTSIKRARGAAALAKYIASAKEKGEKLDQFWLSNCNAGAGLEDLDTAIAEIRATQALNHRSNADPNYHLVVSFAEGEMPETDALKDIELEFAKALGLEAHQRVVGTHINTENFHMHIQFNLVHPETFRMHAPFRDFQILQSTADMLEKKHGLQVVKGRGQDNERLNQKARDKEANSWEQSFSGYLKDHKDAFLQIHRRAGSWKELYDGFALYGVELRKRGNGLVFRDIATGTMEKASMVDRELSRIRLEEKYGQFEPYKNPGTRQTKDRYRRRPLDPRLERHPAWKRMTIGQPGRQLSWRRFLEQQAGVDAEAREALELQKSYLRIITGQDPQQIRTRQITSRKSKGMSR